MKEQKSAVNPAVLTPSSILIFDPWQCLLSLQYPGKIANNCINSARWPEGKCLMWSSWKHPRVLYSLIIFPYNLSGRAAGRRQCFFTACQNSHNGCISYFGTDFYEFTYIFLQIFWKFTHTFMSSFPVLGEKRELQCIHFWVCVGQSVLVFIKTFYKNKILPKRWPELVI